MYRHVKFGFTFLVLLLHSSLVFAEVSVSGFASIFAGKVTDGSEFLADYPNTGIYDTDLSFSPDTTLGIQLNADINDNFDFIVQAVSNGASDFDVEIDWAYVNYQLNSEVSIQAGRKRLPLYYYSDFYNVGHAYYWIRPPTDNYTWQISNYNGISVEYQPSLGEWDTLFSLYTGREDSDDNELLSLLFDQPVDETWKNMLGLVAELSKDWIELRATYMQGELDRTINNVVTEENIKQDFSGISINLYPYDFIILSEVNRYKKTASDICIDTNMLSLGYQFGNFTPHITHSEFKQADNSAGGDENHNTISIGLRWDIEKSTAFKIQYDKVKDNGINIPVLGDSETIALGIDIVF